MGSHTIDRRMRVATKEGRTQASGCGQPQNLRRENAPRPTWGGNGTIGYVGGGGGLYRLQHAPRQVWGRARGCHPPEAARPRAMCGHALPRVWHWAANATTQVHMGGLPLTPTAGAGHTWIAKLRAASCALTTKCGELDGRDAGRQHARGPHRQFVCAAFAGQLRMRVPIVSKDTEWHRDGM